MKDLFVRPVKGATLAYDGTKCGKVSQEAAAAGAVADRLSLDGGCLKRLGADGAIKPGRVAENMDTVACFLGEFAVAAMGAVEVVAIGNYFHWRAAVGAIHCNVSGREVLVAGPCRETASG